MIFVCFYIDEFLCLQTYMKAQLTIDFTVFSMNEILKKIPLFALMLPL